MKSFSIHVSHLNVYTISISHIAVNWLMNPKFIDVTRILSDHSWIYAWKIIPSFFHLISIHIYHGTLICYNCTLQRCKDNLQILVLYGKLFSFNQSAFPMLRTSKDKMIIVYGSAVATHLLWCKLFRMHQFRFSVIKTDFRLFQ